MQISTLVLAGVLSLPALAVAGPLPSAETRDPPVWTEPTGDFVRVATNGDEGYTIYNSFWGFGIGSKADRFRVEVAQGGKILGKDECSGSYREDLQAIHGSCRVAKLKAKGVVELRLIYEDDATDKAYLVKTHPLTIREWKGNGDRYAYLPDDLLAVGYVNHLETGTNRGFVAFDFWTTAQEILSRTAAFRCTVDGKKIADLEAYVSNAYFASDNDTTSASRADGTRTIGYSYRHVGAVMKAHFGPPREGNWAPQIVEHPGAWECNLRVEGKVFRTFTFTVNKEGRIEASELQSKATKPFRTLPGTVVVDMKIPKDAPYEVRMRNDAMKKSIGFGTPWPESPKAKAAQAALPPTMGTPD